MIIMISIFINDSMVRISTDWNTWKLDFEEVDEMKNVVEGICEDNGDYVEVETSWSRDKFDCEDAEEIYLTVRNHMLSNLLDREVEMIAEEIQDQLSSEEIEDDVILENTIKSIIDKDGVAEGLEEDEVIDEVMDYLA